MCLEFFEFEWDYVIHVVVNIAWVGDVAWLELLVSSGRGARPAIDLDLLDARG